MPDPLKPADVLSMTTEIVSAYASRNPLTATEVSALIERVYKTLGGLATLGGGSFPSSSSAAASSFPREVSDTDSSALTKSRPKPAVAIRKSLTPDYIVCLEDGKKMKMLKRYLRTFYNMTPEQYRERWGLSPDYPMVAPNYAKERSRMATEFGLGKSNAGRRRRAASPRRAEGKG